MATLTIWLSLFLRGPNGEPENVVEFLETLVQVMQLFGLWDIFWIAITVSVVFGVIMKIVDRVSS